MDQKYREEEAGRKPSRLQFTKEEADDSVLEKPSKRAQKAARKPDVAQADIPQRPSFTAEAAQEAPARKRKQRLRFSDVEQTPKDVAQAQRKAKLADALTDAPVDALHREIAEHEDENVGVEAAHKSEEAAEGTYRLGRSISHARKMQPYRKAVRAEREADKANLERLYEKAKQENPEGGSNPFSRWQQRQRIKQQYAAAKAGRKVGGATGTAAGAANAATKAKEAAKRVVVSVQKGGKSLLIIGVLAFIVMMIGNGLSSCGQMGIGGLNAVLSTSFVSEDRDIQAVDKRYTRLEDALDRRIDNIEREYAGYDEYRYFVDEIGHNPYVLMAYLTAKYVSFTPADVQNDLEALFAQQYSLNVVETIEIRYRTEPQPVPTINPRTGRETTVIKDVEVPYEYRILTVELRNHELASIVNTGLNAEQQEMYKVLMETKGNKPELFPEDENPFVNSLDVTPPEPYALPPEALSDPSFAALIAEANKYLGYPYVWGGSKPSTSFDCSGFTCWVLNQSGVASVGRTNARGLYKRSTVVSEGNAQPGDLVFFTGARAAEIGHPVTHVGIYVGGGMMIHCAGNGVEYKSITDSKYYRTHLYAYGRLSG